MELSGTIWIALILLISVLSFEVLYPKRFYEGFQGLITPVEDKDNFFSQFAPRRGDVGFNLEENNYIQDNRYFRGYGDVQGFGFKHDFIRVVIPEVVKSDLTKVGIQKSQNNNNSFIAAALAGTNGASSVSFRSKGVSDGLRLSRDDYIRDIRDDNHDAYCRILKMDGTFQPLCLRSLDTKFSDKDEVDPNPPENILTLLNFYDGCLGWLRFRDDMLDYISNLTVQTIGGILIDETPNPTITRGVSFNGIDQYIRISDSKDLTLGSKINLRTIRAFSVWVYFDSFTNNAHIFDFGDGAGNNNIHLGILGKGDDTVSDAELRPLLCGSENATLPNYPSGPHPCKETTPQNLMMLKANVNEFECNIFDTVEPRNTSSENKTQTKITPTRATLLYEVWDAKQRKMRIKVNKVIPLNKWAHITITAKSNDSFRPDIGIYVNGTQVYMEPSGYLPQAKSTTNNYLGKSNWSNQTSQYELKDELFNGKLFDFRMYNTVMSEEKIKKSLQWGMNYLGIL